MKKLLLFLVTIIFLFLIISCSSESEIKKEIEETYWVAQNHDNHFVITGDTKRQQRAVTFTNLLKDKYREQYPLVDSLIVRKSKPCKIKVTNDQGKKVIGFKVNDVEIPFSKKIFNEGNAIFGNGTSLNRNKQRAAFDDGKGICYEQLADFEAEFLRVVKNIKKIQKKRMVQNPAYVAPTKATSESSSFCDWPSWWPCIRDTIQKVLGIFLVLVVLGLLGWLLRNLFRILSQAKVSCCNNQATSNTDSHHTHHEHHNCNCKNECSECEKIEKMVSGVVQGAQQSGRAEGRVQHGPNQYTFIKVGD